MSGVMPILHVTNGDSTAEPLRATGIDGDIVVWADALHEGPVPDVPRVELRRRRAAFLADGGWKSAPEIETDLARRDERVTAALAAGTPVVLWFEHDLYDQLQVLEVLSLVERPDGVELIVIGAFPGRPGFRGLGELDAEELATLWPQRQPLTAEQLALAHRAWAAVRAADPGLLRSLLEGDTGALPYLGPALHRLLAELPDAQGLSLGERLLLEALADGPLTPHELFDATQDREEAPFAGDTWVWRRLSGLGSLVAAVDGSPVPPPPATSDDAAYGQVRVTLTDAGRRLLGGDGDRVELLGIDRWVGGIHLRPGHIVRR
jgi:hypothetical protein